jgi:hypothetical protein
MKYMVDRFWIDKVVDDYNLRTKDRYKRHVWNRSAFFNFMYMCGFTLAEIGKISNRDHSTVIHGLKIYEDNLRYEDFTEFIKPIEADLQTAIIADAKTYNDICIKEAISLAYLETLIAHKL